MNIPPDINTELDIVRMNSQTILFFVFNFIFLFTIKLFACIRETLILRLEFISNECWKNWILPPFVQFKINISFLIEAANLKLLQSNRGMTTFWEIHFRTSVEWTITEVYSLDFTDFPPILNYYCGWNILASASKPTITTIKNERKPSMEPQTKKHISIWFSIICALISQLYSMYAAINIFQSFVYKTLSHQRLSQAPP